MNSKKILIVSNYFYPELTPRAFRTHELVKAFLAKGYLVELVIPNKRLIKECPVSHKNLIVHFCPCENSSISSNNDEEVVKNSKTLFKYDFLRKFIVYFLPKEIFLTYNNDITKVLLSLKGDFCAVISISHPISIHFSVIIGSFFNRRLRIDRRIAEFSDPLFKGDLFSVFPFYALIGYLFSAYFNCFVVPIEKSKDKFRLFKKSHKIHIIPQGFELNKYKIAEFTKNEIPTFAYAGRFYEKLRDPLYFFDFLKEVKINFIFKLYLKDDDEFRNKILQYQNQIVGSISIMDFIPREELIFELSKCDFLINFENNNEAMKPSKLIDYAISKRPILSFTSNSFNPTYFYEFLGADFQNQHRIEIMSYDINKVIEEYVKLIER
jgi:hypothetical protein